MGRRNNEASVHAYRASIITLDGAQMTCEEVEGLLGKAKARDNVVLGAMRWDRTTRLVRVMRANAKSVTVKCMNTGELFRTRYERLSNLTTEKL